MSWFRAIAGGENHPVDVNVECVEYVRYVPTGDGEAQRVDAVLYMRNGEEFRVDPVTWEMVRGPLVAVRPEGEGT